MLQKKAEICVKIARIDVVYEKEYKGIFLQKILGKITAEQSNDFISVVNEEDKASFKVEDIVCKQSPPFVVGGSRKSNQLKFGCDVRRWD